MQRFSRLYAELDRTTETDAKLQALVDYFRDTPAEDAAWAVFFLTGQRVKRLISDKVLRDWALKASGLPDWLVTEAHAAVGDGAETISLLLDRGFVKPAGAAGAVDLHRWIEERILPLRGQPVECQEALVTGWWNHLPRAEVFLLNKLLTGGIRVDVSKPLVISALATLADLPRPVISYRLTGEWQPMAERYRHLINPDTTEDDHCRPYPFLLASTLEEGPEALGTLDDWQAEWKWQGIRAQLIRRGGETFLWTRTDELVTERYPELSAIAEKLPDGVVLDGTILAWDEGGIMPFAVLQKRINRAKLGPAILKEAPVSFVAHDLLEEEGEDCRTLPLSERRYRLEAIVQAVGKSLMISPLIQPRSWRDLSTLRDESRRRRVEGLMLKRRTSAYGAGRQHGDWWKWPIDPLSLDAVLIYAEASSGRRASPFTDYTFAVWHGEELVPIAKAASGLSDEEIQRLDRWIRQNTIERFGPVRQVTPRHVFELAFEGISPSKRRKSGLALRLPHIARWRSDKQPKDADTLEQARALLDL
ncbi:MAG: ATP-dependent DNA ligase [Alphaproteobacteria bacterium]|nr:ATP-dependent DNA ligase [Alphaproteobacteria bacterium]